MITLLTLVIAGEIVFFLPFLLPRIFRPTMLVVFDISNVQLGAFFSAYGVIAMLSYAFGGPLADRFSAKRLMAVALWLTAMGGVFIAFIPSPAWLVVIYGFWGFTTIFLFWAAMIRATREWGGPMHQGRAFGWLEGGRGLVAAILGTLTWLVFAQLSIDEEALAVTQSRFQPFQKVIFVTSLLTALTGWLVWTFIPDNKEKLEREPHDIVLRKIGRLVRMSTVWSLAIIIICAYSGYKITDDFSLYAREVLGFSEIAAAATGVSALWLRGIVAIVTGLLADRLNKTNMISACFALSLSGGLLTGLGVLEWSTLLVLLNMTALATGIYAIRALYFAVLREAGIPLTLTGTAVGIVSFLGYTPDVFMSPWMGHLLDNYPGETGHRYVFIVLAGFGFIGLITSMFFRRFSGTQEI
ncbi:MAG: MFS transporter [Bacteroidales bacterium]|nr:MFS transporter [Bacteroidales bacterium]MDT8431123.1 MFS transporter [Bacteroidales bacterium]